MIRDYPETSQLSSAWHQRGQCLVDLGRHHDAIEALEEFGGGEVFPVSVYRHAVTRALIADAMGERATARGYAQQALAAAAKDESPFRYHRKLGLVRFVDPDVLAKLRELCAA